MPESDRVRAAREELMSDGLVRHRGVGDVVPDVIERSWRRSISHRVAPDRVADEAREIDVETVLYRAAAPVLTHWEERLADTPMTLLLSDRAGRIVARRLGEKGLRSRLDQVRAAEGFDFSEETMGTNGLGTALAEGRSVLVSGSQHYNDLLSSLTCAAAPVVAPGGSIVGSVSLGGPVEATSALMLSLTREIGQQVEERLRAQTRPEDLALALSFMRYKNSRRPTVVVDRHSMMANTPGLPFVSMDSHLLRWELLSGHDWRRQEVLEFTLPSGTTIAGRQVHDSGEPRYVVHFFDPAQQAVPGPTPVAAGVAASGRTPTALAEVLVVDGPAGSGRLTVAQELLATRSATDSVVLVAGASQWAARAGELLADGKDVIVRRLEDLTDEEGALLQRLVLEHRQAASSGERSSVLVLTATSSRVQPSVRDVLARVGAAQVIPDLSSSRDRIPGLVRDLLNEIDPDGRHSLAPGALQAFLQHSWPGQVRELRQTLVEVLAGGPAPVIERAHLPHHLRSTVARRQLTLMEAAERDAILKALTIAEGNKSAAAELLGIGRTTLYRRMRQLQVETDGDSL
jgi:transcriptional regulator of acetoin/glycerol metabolism